MRLLRLLVLNLALAVCQHVTAAIVPDQWGVTASTYWADCSFLPLCDKISFLAGNPMNQQGLDGGLNQSTAFQSDVMSAQPTLFAGNVDMGLANAEAELDISNTTVPILRASAASNSINGWVSGLAFGIAGYDYSGPAGNINLSATLTGSVINGVNSDTTGLSVGIWLIRDDGSLAFPDPPPTGLNDLAVYVTGLPTEDFWITEQTATDDDINVITAGDDIISIAFTDNLSPATYAATATAGNGGDVSPAYRTVNIGETATFTVSPDTGFARQSAVSGNCPSGTWSVDMYTTEPLVGDCSMVFEFYPVPVDETHTVSVTSGSLGSVTPASIIVGDGQAATFAVTPNEGYRPKQIVGGTCPLGTWMGNDYETGSVTADCTVSFTYEETGQSGALQAVIWLLLGD